MEINLVFPFSHVRITFGILSAVVLSVVVAFDPFFKSCTVLVSIHNDLTLYNRLREVHQREFVLRWDVEEVVTLLSVAVEVFALVH